MKFRFLLSAALLAGVGLSGIAQTHKEGIEYYKADQFANAAELLDRNMNNPGTDKAISNYYLGLIALKAQQPEAAKKYFDAGIAANPDCAFNYIGLGQIALLNKNVKQAETYFKEAKSKVKAKEDKPQLFIDIARAYYEVDPVAYAKEIQKNFDDAVKSSPKEKGTNAPMSPEIYIFEGDMAKDKRDAGAAGNKYEMAIRYNPNTPEAYVKYANLFTEVNPQFAILKLKELLSIDPNSALGQRELALAYDNKNDYANAVKEYEKYIKNPNHFRQDEVQYALLLFNDSNYEGGYKFASDLLAQDPSNFTAQRFQFLNAAQIEDMKDQWLPLAEGLLKAHKANPKNRLAQLDYTLIGDELEKAGRADEAQALFEEAISLDPENPQYYKLLSQNLRGQRIYDKAADNFNKFIELKKEPNFNDVVQQARYNYNAGQINYDKNKDVANQYFNIANQSADRALTISGDYPTPYIIKGEVAIAMAPDDNSRNSAAVDYFTKAIEIIEATDPAKYKSDAVDLYDYLGRYYAGSNQKSKALDYYNKLLQLDPENQTAKKMAASLK